MPTPKDDNIVQFVGWPGGVNNRVRETEQVVSTEADLPVSLFLREAVNVDLTALGTPLRRAGYTKTASGHAHSLFSDPEIDFGVLVFDGHLSVLRKTGEITQLKEVTSYLPVSCAVVNQQVYWSNGEESGRIGAAGNLLWWGLDKPAAVSAVAVTGDMAAGRYMVSATYRDGYLEESGAAPVVEVDLTDNQALELTASSDWPDDAVSCEFFVSQPNGELLYSVGEVGLPGGILTVYRGMLGRGRELETQDMRKPSAGHIVRLFSGRIYIARHGNVHFTEPLRYGLSRPAQGIYMFPCDRVLLLEPVRDGIYVGYPGKVVFISGTDPYDIRQVDVLNHTPVERAVARVPAEMLGQSGADVPVWWGQDGAMVAGLDGGQTTQLTKNRVAVPKFQKGAMTYREREGIAQVVSSMARGQDTLNLAATDYVVAEVRSGCKKLN